MKVLHVVLVYFIIFSIGCSKDAEVIEIKNNNEILETVYLSIYNKWKLVNISGGFSGQGQPYMESTFLEIEPGGKYTILINDVETEKGKIEVVRQSDKELVILFKLEEKEEGVSSFFGNAEKTVVLTDTTLDLIEPCCDQFGYHFTL